MDDSDLDSFNVSFIDIVKNFLGLLVLILVLVQGSVAVTETFRAPLRPGNDKPLSPFNAPLRDYIPPFTDHYHVAGNRIHPIDMGRLSTLVGRGELSKAGTKIDLLGPSLWPVPPADTLPPTLVKAVLPIPIGYRIEGDIHTYSIALVFPTMEPVEGPPPEKLTAVIDNIVAKSQNGARSIHFYVADTGFPLFSAVHRALSERQVCFRWYAYKSEEAAPMALASEWVGGYTYRRCRVRRS
jgi:hypothetical protein